MINEKIQLIADKLSPQGRDIFLAMIPAYKSGYADYVFQTEIIDRQNRRIKNLDKNFRRLLTEPYFWIQAMSQESAEDIIAWDYSALSVFGTEQENLGAILSEEARVNKYFEVIRNGALFGFAAFMPQRQGLKISLAMKPGQTDKGLEHDFYQAVEKYALENFDKQQFILCVVASNKGALALFQKEGYQVQEAVEDYVVFSKNIKKEENHEAK